MNSGQWSVFRYLKSVFHGKPSIFNRPLTADLIQAGHRRMFCPLFTVHCSLFIKPLQVAYSILTPAGFCWSSDAVRLEHAFQSCALHTGKRERMPQMGSSYSDLFTLILMALAVGFMLWALWNFHKAERER